MEEGAALTAVRSWVRLDRAFRRLNRHLAATHGVTGEQLAILRLIAAEASVTIAHLRTTLLMHPATLGQVIDRLVTAGLVHRESDPADRRRRVLTLSAAGRDLLKAAPLAGPVRLRVVPAEAARLERLAAALEDAIDLFGLSAYLEE